MLLLLWVFLWGLISRLEAVSSFFVLDPKAAIAAFFIFVIVVSSVYKDPPIVVGTTGGRG